MESQCNQELAKASELTMSEGLTVRKRQAGSAGLASDEASDSWVTFRMNGSLEMGNLCGRDPTCSSQCSVSKKTPETDNYSSAFLSREQTNKCIEIDTSN